VLVLVEVEGCRIWFFDCVFLFFMSCGCCSWCLHDGDILCVMSVVMYFVSVSVDVGVVFNCVSVVCVFICVVCVCLCPVVHFCCVLSL